MDHMPGVFDAAKRAYRDLHDVYADLRNLMIIALVLTLALLGIKFLLSWRGPVVELAANIAFGFVITPYLIAVHRFIILGEVTTRYALVPRDPRFQRFFGWSVVFALLGAAPWLLSSILPFPALLRGVLAFALAIAVLIVSMRLIIVLPAVAVDSERVTWRGAMADTAGYAGRIFLICLVAGLPVGLAAAILFGSAAGILSGFFGSLGLSLLALVGTLVVGVADVALASLLVVIASRLYGLLGDRVRA